MMTMEDISVKENAVVLPEGWRTERLQNVCDVRDNLRSPINTVERNKRIEGKSQHDLYPYYGATGQVGWIDDYLTDGEYVLIGEDGAPFFDFAKAKAYLIKGKTWVNNHAHILEAKSGVSTNRFVLHYLNGFNYNGFVNGTTRLKLTKGSLVEIPIPLPPIAEQHRIVSKIEELFSELEKGKEQILLAQQQLKTYRQAVLKWAFEGRLTNADEIASSRENATQLLRTIEKERSKAGIKSKEPQKRDGTEETTEEWKPELPSGWSWATPSQLCAPEKYALGIGPFGSNLKVSDYRDSGVPLVFVKNITRNDFFAGLKFVTEEKAEELSAHAVGPLDLLITKMGDPPGDCAIYPENRPKGIISADCIKFRVWDKYINRKYVKYCIETQLIKRQIGQITQGVAQKKISLERFKNLQFPLAPLEEQHRIVQEIESRLSVCDAMEATLQTSLAQAEVLRQSILKRAFEGRLG